MRRFWAWFKATYMPWETEWDVDPGLGFSVDRVGKSPRLAKDMLEGGFEDNQEDTKTWPKWSEDDQEAYEYELARDYPK